MNRKLQAKAVFVRCALAIALGVALPTARAAVTEQEAAKLGKELTPVGAERAPQPDLSTLAISLLKGVLYREDDERLWGALLNLQARVRSPSIWALANAEGHLLLTTANRSETVSPTRPIAIRWRSSSRSLLRSNVSSRSRRSVL